MRIYGKNSALERLRTQPQSVKKIILEEGLDSAGLFRQKANKNKIPVMMVPASKMQKLSQGKNTQGVILDVAGFEYVPFDELLETAVDKKIVLFFIDRLTDPQNLGAIIRSLACLGRFALVLPTHETVSVNETVLRVASGGDNYVQIAMVSNLNTAIREARDSGYMIAGTVVGPDAADITEVSFPSLSGVVIGSEEKGIREGIIKNVDMKITVPMAHHTMSLNAAHAAAIIAYEIIKQKKDRKKAREQQ
jgi:23S rRNA (guanosine2251-2'-O)-methyltransferase